MSFHTVAWSESVDQATVDNLVAIADGVTFTAADNLRSPGTRIYAAYGIGVSLTRARITSPSVRKKATLELSPLDRLAEPVTDPPLWDMWDKPFAVKSGEVLNGQGAEDGAGATRMSVIAWIGDEIAALPEGEIYTVRATGTATLVAYAWSDVVLTYDTTLDEGLYHIVGMRVRSAGAIAARVVLGTQALRPGCIAADDAEDQDAPRFRFGRAGSWGTFPSENLPSVQVFSASADTAETVWFDVVGPFGE